jgi:hypothetical protein
MTEARPDIEQVREWWHIYQGPLMGVHATMIAANSPKSPDEIPDTLPDTGLRYVTSFDHEPTETEIEAL